jgi:flavin reductase (DIM6/NTAB) family NADH-FMN oxidoreductase RutF
MRPPMAIEVETFKRVLGSWASGVTIVTSRYGELQHGMTASAFASVSADPPQILICANRESNTHAVIECSRCFSVSILAAGQEELSNLFADKSREDVRFDGLVCATGATGCPRIPGALAHLDCRVAQAVPAGTHVIYVGLIEAASVHDAVPLAFYRGRYQRLA